MAAELGVSQATVRHWLGRLGLKTATAERRRLLRESLEQEGVVPTAVCAIHGRAPFRRRADGGWRCLHCASAQVAGRRRRVKELLVAEAGGRCVLCGYDGYAGALQFHHVDPADKDFGLALRGVARSLARARAEAAKCVLLCANCHAEVEGGLAELP